MKLMECLIWEHQFCIKETDSSKLKEIFDNLLKAAGFGIVAFIEEPFRGGYFAEWVLQESHFVVRVRPNNGITYCEISSCNMEFFLLFVKLVKSMTISTTKMKVWSSQMTIGRTEPKKLREDLEKVIQKAGLRVTKFVEHCFPGDGVTWAFVFEDGDGFFNLHSFPEDGKTYCKTTFLYRSGFILLTGLLEEKLGLP